MAEITYREALNQALSEEISRDSNVVLMGEEVAQFKGSYKVSEGLLEEFGPERIIDTASTEQLSGWERDARDRARFCRVRVCVCKHAVAAGDFIEVSCGCT